MVDHVDKFSALKKQKADGQRVTVPALIDLRSIVKIYESAAGKVAALNGVNLQIFPGEFVAVIGKSGSGKTTLMNIITGIDRPTIGEVFIAGTALHNLNEGATAVWRGNSVGVVFQFFQLLPTLNVIENVMLPMDFCHRYSLKERQKRALYLLDQVELVDYANRLPSALSGGQQQRVAIARALANDPPILVADEPTGNLDSTTAASVFSLFEKLVNQGKTIVMVTHDQDLVKQVFRTIFIKDGRIVGDETRNVARKGKSEQSAKTPSDGQDPLTVQVKIARIIEERKNPVNSLRQILDEQQDHRERELLYQEIFEEIKTRAEKAQEIGDTAEARYLWGILVEMTGK
jgi:putative ABC transport system ATP-binding protein